VAGLRGSRLAAAAALVLMLAALLFNAWLWPRAAWYLVPASDRPLTERALRDGAANFAGTTADSYRWRTRPIVSRSPGLDCVALATGSRYGGGSYRACYDARTGELVEERASSH